MKKIIVKLTLTILLFAACAKAQGYVIDTFLMDYPHGEYRIHVKKTGETYLYYGAGALAKVIKSGTFSAEHLYNVFKPHLHPNLPREKWPNPKSQAGMVTIRHTDGHEESFLIYDLQEFTEEIFNKAKHNIIKDFYPVTQPDRPT